MLYRANRDGFQITDYWPKVKGKSRLIHIIKAESGRIFGGYQSKATDTSNYQRFTHDAEACIFSVTDRKVYKIKKNEVEKALFYKDNNYMIIFGDGDITIANGSDKAKLSFTNFGYDYGCYKAPSKMDEKTASESLAGESEFKVDDIEVY